MPPTTIRLQLAAVLCLTACMPASAPATIHTLTGNLLAEYTFTCDPWSAGKTHRAETASFQVGGKGINVAKMLHRLGHPVRALAFAGGGSGQTCRDWLAAQPFPHRLFPTATPTRVGLVVRSAQSAETTFLGPDTAPDADALTALAAHLGTLPSGDLVALCGSFPGWTSPAAAPLRACLRQLADQGRLIADTYGPPLADLVAGPAITIKINADELRALGAPPPDRHTWIITDGPRAVTIHTPGAATPETLQPPAIREVSATGSGDVFLAAWLHGRHGLDLDPLSAARHALPYAAANAAHPGVADFPLDCLPAPSPRANTTPHS